MKIYNLQFTIYKRFQFSSFLKIAKLKIENYLRDPQGKWIMALFAIIALFYFPSQTFAVTISAAIPGMTNVTTSTPPGAYVSGFYDFALMIGGVLAFGAIVYGGVLYAISMGNPSRQSEGKEWIQSALIGLLLLAGATLILKTINPDLVNLNLPTLQTVNIQTTQSQ
jgi:hypothetical protein